MTRLIMMMDERGYVLETPYVVDGGVCGHGVDLFAAEGCVECATAELNHCGPCADFGCGLCWRKNGEVDHA